MLIQTRAQFDSVLDSLHTASVIAVDTETNGLHPHKGHRLCGVACYFELKSPYALGAYFPFRHSLGDTLFTQGENLPIEWLQELGEVLGRPDLMTRWSNVKFDLGMLRADGVEIRGPIQDTMAMSQMVNENLRHGLEALEYRYLGTSTKNKLTQTHIKPYLKGTKNYSRVPPNLMDPYACNDVRATYLITPLLIEALKQQELWGLWPVEADFLRCLFELEDYGIGIDLDLAVSLSDEAEARMRTLEDEMGFDPQKRAELARRLFLGPPDGLGLPLPERRTSDTSPEFPQGLPGMDEDELSAYDHPLVRSVIQYRRIVKRNSSWYKGFQVHAATDDNRMHPSYNTSGDRDKYGTVTSRMSHSEPNIAQLPRDPQARVRKLIKAPLRFRHYVADYNQIEFRLAGVYSQEQSVLDAYLSGSDMHQLTADNLGIDRVNPMGKVDGKRVNFATLYLAGVERIATVLGIDMESAERIRKAWWANYSTMRKFAYTVNKTAEERGWIKLWDGKRRHFDNKFDAHKAWNSLIQGGAARIMQKSMCMLQEQFPRPFKMIYQVHDALGFEIPDDFREDYIAEITTIMEWPGQAFGLPFPVDWKHVHPELETHTCEECAAA